VVGDGRQGITAINFLATEILFPYQDIFCLCNLISLLDFFFKYRIRYYHLIKKKKGTWQTTKAIFLTVEAHERHQKHNDNKEQGTICQQCSVIGEA